MGNGIYFRLCIQIVHCDKVHDREKCGEFSIQYKISHLLMSYDIIDPNAICIYRL
jgi:hypothetical protein